MKLYNTLTKKIEDFIPWNDQVVTLYTCGPTVYNYAHIGNLRSYIMEDILEKTLRFCGYNVKRCMNITDVGHLTSDSDTGDDKMVASAKKENKSVLDLADFYTKAFFEDFNKLNIKKPEITIKATDNIDMYIKIIEKLLEKDIAYKSGGNIYFDISKISNYYVLNNNNEENLITGARDTVEEDFNKRNKADFALWFTKSKFDDQDLKWDSPFGTGYPGWHIECSGISLKYLGEYLDIHCGGIDNAFPHHTNEIAQSEGYLGHPWCKYWFHVQHLLSHNGKMSKSKGDSLILNTLITKGYDPLAYRYFCLESHYRKQLVFSYEALDNAQNAYQKLKKKVLALKDNEQINQEQYQKYMNLFKDSISNDLNTANALTIVYDLLRSEVNDTTKLNLIKEFDKVLSLDLTINKIVVDKDYIEDMIKQREIAKQNKDYKLADEIRDQLLSENIVLKDTREGTIYEVR